MSGQLSYNYQPPLGIAGTLTDINNRSIDSFLNGEANPYAMKYGMGVVQGNNPGKDVLIPTASSEAAIFEGIAMSNLTTQQTMDGKVLVRSGETIGVLRWGRAWARIVPGLTIDREDPVYLIITGLDAGYFTNVDGDADTISIKGTFTGKVGTGDIAEINLRNQMNE